VAQRKLKKLPSKYKMSIESRFAPEVLVAESAAHYGGFLNRCIGNRRYEANG
jgi:hypothetical protein